MDPRLRNISELTQHLDTEVIPFFGVPGSRKLLFTLVESMRRRSAIMPDKCATSTLEKTLFAVERIERSRS